MKFDFSNRRPVQLMHCKRQRIIFDEIPRVAGKFPLNVGDEPLWSEKSEYVLAIERTAQHRTPLIMKRHVENRILERPVDEPRRKPFGHDLELQSEWLSLKYDRLDP